MKRFFVLLLSVIIIPCFILSSCDDPVFTKEFFPEKSFTVHMKAEKSDKKFEADITCLNAEDITIAFTYPEELSGFSVKTAEDGYTVNIFGVQDDFTNNEINNASLLNVLIKTVQISVFSNHGLFTETENSYEANITADGIPVFVSFSKDGYLSEIKVDALSFYAQFQYLG